MIDTVYICIIRIVDSRQIEVDETVFDFELSAV